MEVDNWTIELPKGTYTTATNYARYKGVSRNAVNRRIQRKKMYRGDKVFKVGNQYIVKLAK